MQPEGVAVTADDQVTITADALSFRGGVSNVVTRWKYRLRKGSSVIELTDAEYGRLCVSGLYRLRGDILTLSFREAPAEGPPESLARGDLIVVMRRKGQ